VFSTFEERKSVFHLVSKTNLKNCFKWLPSEASFFWNQCQAQKGLGGFFSSSRMPQEKRDRSVSFHGLHTYVPPGLSLWGQFRTDQDLRKAAQQRARTNPCQGEPSRPGVLSFSTWLLYHQLWLFMAFQLQARNLALTSDLCDQLNLISTIILGSRIAHFIEEEAEAQRTS
jgi:hypothetical protein